MRPAFSSARLVAIATVLAGLLLAAPAQAKFGIEDPDVVFTGPPAPGAGPLESGAVLMRAGEHPFAMTTSFAFPGEKTEKGGVLLDERPKDLLTALMPGFAAAPTAVPACTSADFLTRTLGAEGEFVSSCPDSTAVGVVVNQVASQSASTPIYSAVYNLNPSPGEAAKFGLWSGSVPITIDGAVSEASPYQPIAGPTNIPQLVEVVSSKFTLWGVPADPRHDPVRGRCLGGSGKSVEECHVSVTEAPLLTMPRACQGPLSSDFVADSWEHPGAHLSDGLPDLSDPNWVTGSALTHDEGGNPRGMIGCASLPFSPSIDAAPTTLAAQSPTGLDFTLDVHDEGITSPKEGATAGSDIRKAVVTLPEGMTINPSQAEGLEVCDEAQLARERSFSAPGEGCPQASKIGSAEVETPLLAGKILRGSLYVAKPYENLAGNSLIAFYFVIKDRELGVSVVQPALVEPDPKTGQLIATTEEMPQLPFSHVRLRFKEGGRSPLISPPGCGDFKVEAQLYPWSGNPPVTSSSEFEIVSGPDNGPCPPRPAPFAPRFAAGTLNNAAGAFSPFYMRLSRSDGEQDLARFSSVLPRGVVGKIAGIPYCSESDIARALSLTGAHGGEQELALPSCPAASQVGRTIAGAGVGSQLTYVPGKLYLAGPYKGAPLSVVSITPAVAGPFDAGAVVVRVGLTLNRRSGEVEADGRASDPIPHILQGIPLSLRDLRVYVDRSAFTLNATSCEPAAARATLWGAGTALEPLPETPVGLSARYQAADCGSLGFAPRLGLRLKGGTQRGAFPALTATYSSHPGDANVRNLSLLFPRSAFIENAHFRTICTRRAFAEANCPKGSVYGHATVSTPLLAEPLSGPVYLRSSDHLLPDAVLDLHGIVDIEVPIRIDSKKQRLRATVTDAPDAPVSKAVVQMQGGAKGLFVNSRDLCATKNRAEVTLTAQSAKRLHRDPAVKAKGCGAKGSRRARR